MDNCGIHTVDYSAQIAYRLGLAVETMLVNGSNPNIVLTSSDVWENKWKIYRFEHTRQPVTRIPACNTR